MAQPSVTDLTASCTRCCAAAVCTRHAAYATKRRPTAASLIAAATHGRDAARGEAWRTSGSGNPSYVSTGQPGDAAARPR